MKHDALKQYAALLHSLTTQKAKIEKRLKAINKALGGTVAVAAVKPAKKKTKRTMSASARAKIAAAQKARWAKFHAAKKRAK